MHIHDDFDSIQDAMDLIWDNAMKAKTVEEKQWVLDQVFRKLAGLEAYKFMTHFYNVNNAKVTGEWDTGQKP